MCANVLGSFALQELWRTRGEFDDFNTAGELALGVGQHFAMFCSDNSGDSISILFKQPQEPIKDSRAPKRRPHCPAWKGCPCCRNRCANLVG